MFRKPLVGHVYNPSIRVPSPPYNPPTPRDSVSAVVLYQRDIQLGTHVYYMINDDTYIIVCVKKTDVNGRGGYLPEKGVYGDVWSSRFPFHTSPAIHKTPC